MPLLNVNFEDPMSMATLALTAELFGANPRTWGFGRALQAFRETGAQMAQRARQNELVNMQTQEVQRRQEQEAQRRQMAGDYHLSPGAQAISRPGLPPGPTNERAALVPQIPPGFDAQGYMTALLRAGDLEGAAKVAGFIPKPGDGYTLTPGATRFNAQNQPVAAAPFQDDEFTRSLRAAGIDPNSPQGRQLIQQRLMKMTTHQPANQVNVNTAQNPFFGAIGQYAAEKFKESSAQATASAGRLQSNQQMMQLLSQPTFTGAGAEFKLAAGRALQSVGINLAADAVQNTELLATQLAQRTLQSIKTSGLGSGQGFTDKDREFLQKAVGGSIELNAGTLRRLIELDTKAAVAAINAHNRMAAQLQATAPMQGFPLDFSVQMPQLPALPMATPSNPAVEAALRKHLR